MRKQNKTGALAITQILLLIIGIMAISYAIGSSVEVVSAAEGSGCTTDDECADECSGTYLKSGGRCNADGTCSYTEQPQQVEGLCGYTRYSTEAGDSCGDGGRCYPTCGSNEIEIEDCGSSLKCCASKYYIEDEEGNTLDVEIPKEYINEDGEINEGDEEKVWDTLKEATEGLVGTALLVDQGLSVKDRLTKRVLGETTKDGEGKISWVKKLFGKGSAEAESTSKLAQFFGKTPVGADQTFLVEIGGETGVSMVGYIFGTLIVAAVTAALIIALARALGAGERNMQQIIPAALASAGGVAGLSIILAATLGGPPGWAIAAAIIAITGIYTLFTFQKYSQEVFTYMAYVWKPVEGGDDCEKCNDLKYGCSEYQCRSFGEACEIINEGEEEQKCVSSEDDGKPPTISPLASALPEGYRYIESDAVLPPSRGVKIFYEGNEDGCVPPFTSVVLGVETDEPAECKIDVERKQLFDEMVSYLSEGSAKVYNHTLALPGASTPSAEAMGNVGWDVKNGRQHEFYLRCKDRHGNTAPTNFVMEFCVDDGPDIASPEILGTNYLQNSYISYNQSTVPLEVYTNEPADCRWDSENKAYDQMAHTMDFCSQTANDYLIYTSFTYGCTGTLTGLRDSFENKFYIRCKDKPWLEGDAEAKGKRYENRESYLLTLKGTVPLIIDSVTVNNEGNNSKIKDSVEPAKITLDVTTSAGADEGRVRCQYQVNDRYYYFYNDGILDYLYENTQKLDMLEGDHTIPIKCIDLGGNMEETSISFTIEIDKEAPIIVRAFYQNNYLKIITDEEAICRYGTADNVGCDYNYETGTLMLDIEGLEHYVDWNSNTNFYIKCGEDRENGIYPLKNQCSMTVRPFNIYSE